MKTVVVGGHSRNIGKTSVMAGLIREMKALNWTAVKITQYGHGICSHNGEPCGCAPKEHPFVLTEERDAGGHADTCQFLSAGAKRAFWLRARQGQLSEAFPLLEQAWGGDEWVMIESNSIMDLIKPSLYLVVIDNSRGDFKPSALKFLDRADALVTVGTGLDKSPGAWPSIDPGVFENKPIFPLAADFGPSTELCRFVRQKLLAAGANDLSGTVIQHKEGKEQPCQH